MKTRNRSDHSLFSRPAADVEERQYSPRFPPMSQAVITSQGIERSIRNLRGHRVMIDEDLATL